MTRTRAPKGRDRDRADRRHVIDVLLARLARGIPPTAAETALLTEHVREEQRLADATRKTLADTTRALAAHREAADTAIRELEQRADAAEHQIGILYAVDEGRAHGAQRIMNERDEWQQRAEAAEGQLYSRRRALAAILAKPAETPFDELTECAAKTLTRSGERIREAEQRAEQAEAKLASIDFEAGAAHIQLAAALSRPRDTPREDLAAIAAEYKQRAEQAEDLLRVENFEGRARAYEQRLARIRDMADAWEHRLPAAIRTATAAEAVRNAANGDYRPVMFAVTPAQADAEQDETEQAATEDGYGDPVHWTVYNAMHHRAIKAEERAGQATAAACTAIDNHTIAERQLAKAQRRGDIWKAKAEEIKADRDRYRERAEQAEQQLAEERATFAALAQAHADLLIRAELAEAHLAAQTKAEAGPEVVTDRATIRDTLAEPEPAAPERPARRKCTCDDCQTARQ